VSEPQQERPRPRSYTAAEIAAMEFSDPDPILFYFERGKTSDIVAKPKDGKTTFILLGIKALRGAEHFLDLPTKPVPVLYLTEQTKRSFRDKLNAVDIVEGDDFHVFFVTDYHGWDWPDICQVVREECQTLSVGLLVIDTLSKWAKITDENDAGEALRVVGPLQIIAEDNVAVVTLRHAGKGSTDGADVVDAGRGSSAFAGEFDICTVLSRAPGGGHPNRRQLRSVAREDNVPPTLVIELNDGRYVAEGTAPNVEYRGARQFVLSRLPSCEAEAMTEAQILTAAKDQFSRSTLKRVLNGDRGEGGLMRDGLVTGRLGAGGASAKAFGYWRTSAGDEQLGFDG
jgi:hypothetical protein